jgi:signal transduction histidine kinase
MSDRFEASFAGALAFHLLCAELELAAAILDSEGRVLFASPRLEQWLDRPPGSLPGQSLAGPAPLARLLTDPLPYVMQGERIEQEGEHEWQGRAHPLRLIGLPLPNEQGQVSAALVLALETSARRRAEEEQRQVLRLEAVGRQAGGLIHDLNNLLGVVVGHLELLQHGRLAGEQGELLAGAQRSAVQASELVKQCLAYLRLGRSDMRPTDLNARVAEAPALLGGRRAANIRLDLRLSRGLPLIPADPGQLTQAILNLCQNACDAMRAGGTLLLETEEVVFFGESTPTAQRRAGRFVCLHVGDTGQGMTPEVQARIFEPFYTTKPSGTGTGMGLAIVQGVAEQHHGWVECVSTVGLGTRFSLFLPVPVPLGAGAQAGGSEKAEPRPSGGLASDKGQISPCLP